ncbi:MAG: hypothetical protein ABW039_13580 [Sphingobium sp.]
MTMTTPNEAAAGQADAEPGASPEETPEPGSAARKSVSRSVWKGTAVGIGSAALVAALLYAGRNKR